MKSERYREKMLRLLEGEGGTVNKQEEGKTDKQ